MTEIHANISKSDIKYKFIKYRFLYEWNVSNVVVGQPSSLLRVKSVKNNKRKSLSLDDTVPEFTI